MPRTQLVEANGRLSISDSLINITDPGMAGALVQLMGAPKAIILDAIPYLLSAASLAGIRAPEGDRSAAKRPLIWREAADGMRELVRTPVLLALSVATGISILGGNVQGTVQLLFLVNVLHFSPAVLGLLAAADGAGLGGYLGTAIGLRPTLVVGALVSIISCLFLVASPIRKVRDLPAVALT